MSKLLAWFLIAAMGLNFGICAIMSYFGAGVSTATQQYPRIVRTAGSPGGPVLIRSGSVGGGSSRSGGGIGSGK